MFGHDGNALSIPPPSILLLCPNESYNLAQGAKGSYQNQKMFGRLCFGILAWLHGVMTTQFCCNANECSRLKYHTPSEAAEVEGP